LILVGLVSNGVEKKSLYSIEWVKIENLGHKKTLAKKPRFQILLSETD